ncbi:MAG: 1-deoxy-D-xylulose-5-phosphate synthase [Candidatus Melainabacteria bacterium RIFOXYA12_FULL_32_12]|nr:MAG: 1-deoxy-D-xylulose-5-phosphate synthase [Candidatus Melainabacteria bacterium RIFOXYA2_FULL_32_9]OGI30363.1 MAG: 1-deoxy-D-xylulose-5-phosphate synthase [Candidatus Melainabacteria bacterium RIFOXYA12_FULL_32_12]
MRDAFTRNLKELFHKDENMFFITSDTGYKVLDEFQETFPDRYLNIGISEANMIGVAAGLALSGKKVFTYAIAPFITLRCFEQIRVNLCFQNLPVFLVGIGGGLTYGAGGATHHTIEDIAVLNSLPNMTIICPGDPVEVELAMQKMSEVQGPVYLRLGKSGEKVIHQQSPKFEIGKGIKVLQGNDVAIITTGNMLETGYTVCEMLTHQGLNPGLISMHTVKPIDKNLIEETAKQYKLIVTIEEHNVIGGLGSSVSDVITERDLNVRFKKFGIPDRYVDVVGSQEFLRAQFGLKPEQISADILNYLKGKVYEKAN